LKAIRIHEDGNDRAAARDLAYFVRSGRVHKIRISDNPRPGLEWFVHRYPGRVVELANPGATVPKDVIGFLGRAANRLQQHGFDVGSLPR